MKEIRVGLEPLIECLRRGTVVARRREEDGRLVFMLGPATDHPRDDLLLPEEAIRLVRDGRA